jgi:hypothetical protein
VARVGGSLFLYVFAPYLYQMLPGGLVGWHLTNTFLAIFIYSLFFKRLSAIILTVEGKRVETVWLKRTFRTR